MADTSKLWFYIDGTPDVSSVSVSLNETIAHLKSKIHAKAIILGYHVLDFILTQVDVDLDAIDEAIHAGQRQLHTTNKPLRNIRKNSDVWPQGPPEGLLHVSVRVDPTEGREYKRKRDAVTEADIPPGLKLLKTETGKASPSPQAVPLQFSQISGPLHAIACNRPFEYNTIPLVLFHKAFGIFKDRCKAAPSERALAFLEKLTSPACEWYQDETKRRTAIQFVFSDHLGLDLPERKIPGTEHETDGAPMGVVMPPAIRGCKNDNDTGALNQAILYYCEFLRGVLADRHCFHSLKSSFPCILIVDTGPSIGFYGAAWDGERVKVEPLAPRLDLTTYWKEIDARRAIASCFDGLVDAIANIQAHYEAIDAEARATRRRSEYELHVHNARRYPFLTSYDDHGQETSFTYDERLDEDKLVFSATVNQPGSGECIVKFTWQYSQAAHEYLASRDMAPGIRKCIRISADWTAVVMDQSKYELLFNLLLLKPDQEERIEAKVKTIVRTLHEGGFVHGDIRDTNIFVNQASLTSDDDDVTVHLIDFDWAGYVGEVKYPMEINCRSVKRPDGVKGGKLITQEHDNEMVSYLFAKQSFYRNVLFANCT